VRYSITPQLVNDTLIKLDKWIGTMLYSINFHFQLISIATNAYNSRCGFVL